MTYSQYNVTSIAEFMFILQVTVDMQRGDITRTFSYESMSITRLLPSNGPPRGEFEITVLGKNLGDTEKYEHKGTVRVRVVCFFCVFVCMVCACAQL